MYDGDNILQLVIGKYKLVRFWINGQADWADEYQAEGVCDIFADLIHRCLGWTPARLLCEWRNASAEFA